MDPITRAIASAAAGAAGAGDATYVDDVFSTTLYTSNASSNFDGTEQVITTGIDHTEGFLTWIKDRDTNNDHVLFDSERTGTYYPWLYSNDDAVEQDTADIFKNPTSTGFTVKAATSGSGTMRTNPTGSKSMVSWNFRKAPGFFDIVTYTGTGSAHSISHSLGSVPGMIIYKAIDHTREWMVYHRSLGASQAVALNLTNAAFSTSDFGSGPTSTQFSVGSGAVNNTSGKNYIAYIFAHDDQSFGTNGDESIIKCGSFTVTGNASTGDFIDVGFEPQFVLTKTKDITNDWVIGDVMRGASHNEFKYLLPNSSNAEGTLSSDNFYATSTGFRYRAIGGSVGDEVIYMAIRRPHKPPTAGTDVFKAVQTTSQPISVGFPTDLHISAETNSGGARYWVPRLTNNYLNSHSTSPESAGSTYFKFDLQDSFSTGSFFGSAQTINWQFRRAPGFFDVVTYTGTGSNQSISHNLGATPELVIVKIRSGNTRQWIVWTPDITEGKTLRLNDSTAEDNNIPNAFQANSTFTATNFGVGTNDSTNGSGYKYVAFLFASLSGISKVGTYSGTGSNINVDCGFTAGARFVMIKRTDTEINPDPGTDWYVWDSTRGIVSGNDPYLLLNTTTAQVTNTDYIDPLNAGFTVTSSAPAALNTSGGTYLFLAIA